MNIQSPRNSLPLLSNPSVSVFWDNSCIYIPAQYVANKKEGGFASKEIRIHFEHLFCLARAGRPVGRAICVGSDLGPVKQALENAGVQPELYERGAQSGTEQGVDSGLQVHMLRALTDSEPGVAVLLTGDGAGYESGIGFHADLERMHRRGWGIEVISWDCSCNRNLKAWSQRVGAYIELEKHYFTVTFLKGTRWANPVNLTHRPFAKLSASP